MMNLIISNTSVKILVFVSIFLGIVSIAGCRKDRLTTFYDFEDLIINREDLEMLVCVHLSGNFKSEMFNSKKLTVKGNPYDLIIDANTKLKTIDAITLCSVKLIMSSGETMVIQKENYNPIAHHRVKRDLPAMRQYIWSIRGLELEHGVIVVEALLQYELNGEIMAIAVNGMLLPTYREEWSSDLKDRILSI